jgi:hypothetical protein
VLTSDKGIPDLPCSPGQNNRPLRQSRGFLPYDAVIPQAVPNDRLGLEVMKGNVGFKRFAVIWARRSIL